MAKLTAAHRKLADSDVCVIMDKYVFMLTAVAENLPLDSGKLGTCEVWLDSVMTRPASVNAQLVPWCLEQLRETINASRFIGLRSKTRALRLIDVFGGLDTFGGLVQFYENLEKPTPFKKAYDLFAENWSTTLLTLFNAQLDVALAQHPNSLLVIVTVREIDKTLLKSDTVIELVRSLKNGSLCSMEQLAERWRNHGVLLSLNGRLRKAVEDLAAKELKAEAAPLPMTKTRPKTARLGPVPDPIMSGTNNL